MLNTLPSPKWNQKLLLLHTALVLMSKVVAESRWPHAVLKRRASGMTTTITPEKLAAISMYKNFELCNSIHPPAYIGSRHRDCRRSYSWNQQRLDRNWFGLIGKFGSSVKGSLFEQTSSTEISLTPKQIRRLYRKANNITFTSNVTTTPTNSQPLDFENNFEFSTNPRWDTRFDNNMYTLEAFAKSTTSEMDIQELQNNEAAEDSKAAVQLQQLHQAYQYLDPVTVQRAITALRPYVLEERIQRIESILQQRTQHTRFLFESK
jgi:hypothetical protein